MLLFAAIIVFLGAFLFDVFHVPEAPKTPQGPPKKLEHPSGDFKVPDHGVQTLIGKSEKTVKKQYGKPDRKDPSSYGYQWWVYNQGKDKYVQIGIEEGHVVTVFAFGEKLKTKPFTISKKAKDILKGVPLNSDVSFKHKGGSYRFELAEDDLNTRPLVKVGDVWAILYFDRFTQKLEGVRYLDSKTLIDLKPYSLSYRGTPPKSDHPDRKAWRAIEQGEEQQIFDMTNIIRERFGQKKLTKNNKASKAAFSHSKEMKKKDYFSHDSPTEGSLSDRLHKQDASFVQAGGNIASKHPDGIAATFGWLNSEGHRKNLLNEGFTQLGVGVYQKYYTQNFITPF